MCTLQTNKKEMQLPPKDSHFLHQVVRNIKEKVGKKKKKEETFAYCNKPQITKSAQN